MKDALPGTAAGGQSPRAQPEEGPTPSFSAQKEEIKTGARWGGEGALTSRATAADRRLGWPWLSLLCDWDQLLSLSGPVKPSGKRRGRNEVSSAWEGAKAGLTLHLPGTFQVAS